MVVCRNDRNAAVLGRLSLLFLATGAGPDDLTLSVAVDHSGLGALTLDAPSCDPIARAEGEGTAEDDGTVFVPLTFLARPERVVDRVVIVEDGHRPQPLVRFEGRVWLVHRDGFDFLAGGLVDPHAVEADPHLNDDRAAVALLERLGLDLRLNGALALSRCRPRVLLEDNRNCECSGCPALVGLAKGRSSAGKSEKERRDDGTSHGHLEGLGCGKSIVEQGNIDHFPVFVKIFVEKSGIYLYYSTITGGDTLTEESP